MFSSSVPQPSFRFGIIPLARLMSKKLAKDKLCDISYISVVLAGKRSIVFRAVLGFLTPASGDTASFDKKYSPALLSQELGQTKACLEQLQGQFDGLTRDLATVSGDVRNILSLLHSTFDANPNYSLKSIAHDTCVKLTANAPKQTIRSRARPNPVGILKNRSKIEGHRDDNLSMLNVDFSCSPNTSQTVENISRTSNKKLSPSNLMTPTAPDGPESESEWSKSSSIQRSGRVTFNATLTNVSPKLPHTDRVTFSDVIEPEKDCAEFERKIVSKRISHLRSLDETFGNYVIRKDSGIGIEKESELESNAILLTTDL